MGVSTEGVPNEKRGQANENVFHGTTRDVDGRKVYIDIVRIF
jgi:hypothetical protein